MIFGSECLTTFWAIQPVELEPVNWARIRRIRKVSHTAGDKSSGDASMASELCGYNWHRRLGTGIGEFPNQVGVLRA